MKTLRTVWRRIDQVWANRSRLKQDIDEELRFHIDQRTAENVAAGMSPENAAREARKRFGNLQNVREDCREIRGASFAETTWLDIGFGLRMLRKSPGFTVVAILTLAFGIGANTAIFGMLRPILFPTFPYPESNRVLRIFRTSAQSQTLSHSRADFVDYHDQNQAFSHLAAYHWEGFNFGDPGQETKRLTAVQASAEIFSVLGVQPSLGRVFTAEETQPGHNQVAILTHGFWINHFGGDSNIIGRVFRFDGEPVSVIGVMPAAFDCPALFGEPDAWRPLTIAPEEREDRENRFLNIIGRLKPGTTLDQARAAMGVLAARLATNHPLYDGGSGLRVVSLAESLATDSQRHGPWFLFSLTSFVLLIACANLANLQLARNLSRSRELSVRAALGASRSRLLRQLLTESALISLFGGILGLFFAAWGNSILAHNVAVGFQVAFGFSAVVFSLACCLITVAVFGTAPAWLAVCKDLNENLKETVRCATGSRSQHRFQNGLIVGELALALMLLTGAGASIAILKRFARLDPGWRVEDLVTVEVSLPKAPYPPERRLALFGQLEERVAGLPGVQCVSFTTDLPIVSYWNTQPLRIEGSPVLPRNAMPLASAPTVGSAYFEALGIGLRQGRFFNTHDNLSHPAVAIINQTMARQFWPGQDALGKRVSIGDPDNPQWIQIVGIVGDVFFPADADRPETHLQVYRPWAQDEVATGGRIVVRTTTAPESVVAALRRTVAELDPNLSFSSVSTVRQTIDGMKHGTYVVVGLLGAFGCLGLLLAALGIYGVTSYATTQRTAEIGIRMAMGARKHDVFWLVLHQGLRLGTLGGVVGFAGSFVILRILDTLIPEGSLMRDPVTLAGVPVSCWGVTLQAAMVLIGVTLLACYLPARRAANIDPMAALRCE